MIEISQIKIPCGADPGQLMDSRIRKILRLRADVPFTWRISRHSVDARKKPELFDVYSVRVEVPGREQKILERNHDRNVRQSRETEYVFSRPAADAPEMRHRPVIVGFGPAGIFCALMLARAGYRPIVMERGQKMEDRTAAVKRFWSGGLLDPESNLQFGEGGAGTFSDGKLNSNVKDASGRTGEVLRCLTGAGAPEDILTEQLPHIGTDRLRSVIRTLREEILSLGGEIRFETRMTGLILKNGRITGVRLTSSDGLTAVHPCETVVLAPGHSARDTIRLLHEQGVPMAPKAFAVGFRVSHPQRLINEARYGISDPAEMDRLHLPPAAYKVTFRARDGRGVYSFCMCPGGYVVNASSEPGRLCVNGMSDYSRDSARANSAVVMTVSERDFAGRGLSAQTGEAQVPSVQRNLLPGRTDGVLNGMIWQEELERKAFLLADGKVPVQQLCSFENERPDAVIPSSEELCIRGSSAPGALHTLLPEDLTADFLEGMHAFGRQINGFDGPETYVVGMESRTSSPVRILRDENGESSVEGLYPCGEGAGYAGGIMSAAVDGIRTAEQIAHRYRPACSG